MRKRRGNCLGDITDKYRLEPRSRADNRNDWQHTDQSGKAIDKLVFASKDDGWP